MLHRNDPEVESKLKIWACCKLVSTIIFTNRAVLEATKDRCCYFSLFAACSSCFCGVSRNEVTGSYPCFVNCVYGLYTSIVSCMKEHVH